MAAVPKLHGKLVWNRRVRVLSQCLGASLPPGANVLDVGCGDGSVAAAVMAARSDLQITGIDVLLRDQPQIPVTEFDGQTIPYDDQAFDAVTFVDVLHHTEDPTRLLKEAARVAKRSVHIKDHLADGFLAHPTLRVMDWVGNASFGVALPYNYWTTVQWDQAFTEAKLRVELATTSLGLYPAPLSWCFDRQLHCVWRLVPGSSEPG
jgi:ubiquinone/menaquinone biosynthesis C-methylase UbiE